MKTYRQILVLILSGLLVINVSTAGANTVDVLEQSRTDARIRGVASFLLKRANANYFYLLETRIRDNDYLRCYFPNTYTYAASGDLKSLLRSGGNIWHKSVEKDIRFIATQALIEYVVDKGVEQYLELLDELEIEVQGERYALTSNVLATGPNADPNAAEVNQIVNDFFVIADYFNKVRSVNRRTGDGCAQIVQTRSVNGKTKKYDAEELADELKTELEKLKAAIEKHKDRVRIRDRAKLERKVRDSKLLSSMAVAAVIKKEIDSYKEYIAFIKGKIQEIKATSIDVFDEDGKKIGTKEQFLLKVRLAEEILQYASQNGSLSRLGIDTDTPQYRRFRKYMIFFAEVADAEDKDKVEALLDEITLPPVSFGIKRTPGENALMISSYIGIAGGSEKSPEGKKGYGGLFAPVGLEWTFKRWDKRSLSLMVAPFDFAYPINLEIEGKQEAVQLDDVVIPGIYLSYGYRDKPLTAGIGYSKGRAIRTDSKEERRIMLFFAFDMPLFSFD